jgi:hypothetical protein
VCWRAVPHLRRSGEAAPPASLLLAAGMCAPLPAWLDPIQAPLPSSAHGTGEVPTARGPARSFCQLGHAISQPRRCQVVSFSSLVRCVVRAACRRASSPPGRSSRAPRISPWPSAAPAHDPRVLLAVPRSCRLARRVPVKSRARSFARDHGCCTRRRRCLWVVLTLFRACRARDPRTLVNHFAIIVYA